MEVLAIFGGVAAIFTVVGTTITFVRKHRGDPQRVVSHQIEKRRENAELVRREEAKQTRDDLEAAYVAKLQRQGDDFVVAASRRNPTIVTFHSGQRLAYYSDLPSYKAAGLRGDHHGHDARWGLAPKPVSQLTTTELRKLMSES